MRELYKKIAKIAGIVGLGWLAVVFRTTTGGTLTTSWWGTLGQLGWAYLFASLTWLVFRNNRMGIIGVFVLMHSAYLGMSNGLFQGNWLVDLIGKTSAIRKKFAARWNYRYSPLSQLCFSGRLAGSVCQPQVDRSVQLALAHYYGYCSTGALMFEDGKQGWVIYVQLAKTHFSFISYHVTGYSYTGSPG